jgi:hypothetical protein
MNAAPVAAPGAGLAQAREMAASGKIRASR